VSRKRAEGEKRRRRKRRRTGYDEEEGVGARLPDEAL